MSLFKKKMPYIHERPIWWHGPHEAWVHRRIAQLGRGRHVGHQGNVELTGELVDVLGNRAGTGPDQTCQQNNRNERIVTVYKNNKKFCYF